MCMENICEKNYYLDTVQSIGGQGFTNVQSNFKNKTATSNRKWMVYTTARNSPVTHKS